MWIPLAAVAASRRRTIAAKPQKSRRRPRSRNIERRTWLHTKKARVKIALAPTSQLFWRCSIEKLSLEEIREPAKQIAITNPSMRCHRSHLCLPFDCDVESLLDACAHKVDSTCEKALINGFEIQRLTRKLNFLTRRDLPPTCDRRRA